MKNPSVRRLAVSAVIAAVYAALTMSTGFMSYGSVQFRIAEALGVLPFFFPVTTWGVFVGCLIANLLSPIGAADLVVGSLTTLAACLCVTALGRTTVPGERPGWGRCVLTCLVPVVFNAVTVGALLAWYGLAEAYSAPFWLLFLGNAASVGFGEAVVMFALGLPLMRWLPASRFYKTLAAALDKRGQNG